MREDQLPSPDIGQRGYHLRRASALAISQVQIAASYYPSGKHPDAATLRAFFLACATAVDGVPVEGGGNTDPVLTLSGTFPDGKLGVPYSTQLTVSPAGGKTTVSPTDAAALAAAGLAWNGTTNTISGTVS